VIVAVICVQRYTNNRSTVQLGHTAHWNRTRSGPDGCQILIRLYYGTPTTKPLLLDSTNNKQW